MRRVSAAALGTSVMLPKSSLAPWVAAKTESSGFQTQRQSCTRVPLTVSRRVTLRTVLKHSENQIANK